MSDEAIVRQLTRSALVHLIERVMKVQSLALPEALRKVYASALFAKIKDPETGLYREGPVNLYDMLRSEVKNRETPARKTIDGRAVKLIKSSRLNGEGGCFRVQVSKKHKENSDGNLCW